MVGSTASISTLEFEPALVKDIKLKLEDFASQNMRFIIQKDEEMTTAFRTFGQRLWDRV